MLFRGSSALCSFRLSTALFTTMASADSSLALTKEASPGKVHELSARAIRLYPMRLSVTVGFCASPAAGGVRSGSAFEKT